MMRTVGLGGFIGALVLCLGCSEMPTRHLGRETSATQRIGISKNDVAQIIDRETKSNEYEKTRELDKLKEILAPDFVACFGLRTMTRDDVIRSQQTARLNTYAMSNLQLKPITKSVVIIYYVLEQDGVGSDGVKWDHKVAASATYAKRNGIWYSVFYQETVIDK